MGGTAYGKNMQIYMFALRLLHALQMQANRRKVMECPGFVLSNTAEIEFKRIIQTSEQTQVDAVMYGKREPRSSYLQKRH